MTPDSILQMGTEALRIALMLAAPVLLIGLAVAVITGLIQALFQIQDPTVAAVIRIITMFTAVIVLLPWMVSSMMTFTQRLWL